ncbi:amidohydrolase family protein [Paracoccus aestuariivivens]|uniref:Amidohydrolase family protein n=1 Tax=Paracoccus aestuariivivens TaxID=1820333 RepID=A0A6L6J9X1_9RHOB|nr:amidohydrolase family protein [Paracoccus aestuariivivens]MTH76801.1 amidohydrolase family protein [Paracoccus aestuariivivens]
MQVLDAHCHFWRLDRGDYGWLDGKGGPLQAIRRDFTPQQHPGEGPVIAVQAAPSLAETDYLLSLTDPRIVGVVGWVDLRSAQAVHDLQQRAQNARFLGIRPMLQDIPDTDWLLNAPRPEALDTLVELGLTFDALVTERHLPVLAQFADSNPDIPVVIDHAAKPKPADRKNWSLGMQRLSAQGHHCKLSGLLTELSADELRDPLLALRPVVAELLDWFGPDRLIWGSDWPVLNLAGSYAGWRDLTDELLAGLSPDERAAVMGGNAKRFYGVKP